MANILLTLGQAPGERRVAGLSHQVTAMPSLLAGLAKNSRRDVV
jgi:hypothetical protein